MRFLLTPGSTGSDNSEPGALLEPDAATIQWASGSVASATGYVVVPVAVETLRVITDRWEWASIAQLGPTVYHEQSWTLASVSRLRHALSLPISFGYVRVWVDDTLIGCPLIRLGDRWFNTPRAVPIVLRGVRLNAAAAMLNAIVRSGDKRWFTNWVPIGPPLLAVDLHDDSKLLASIDNTRLLLAVKETSTRRFRSMNDRELNTIVASLQWADRTAALEWRDALRATWQAGDWATEVLAHHADGDIIGYTVWVQRRHGDSECIGAAAVGAPVPAWCVSR